MSDLQIVGCCASLETASCVAKSLGHNVKSVDIGISIEEGLKAFIHDFAGGGRLPCFGARIFELSPFNCGESHARKRHAAGQSCFSAREHSS